MTAAALATRWPELVWDAPMLRGLDLRARAEIEAAGCLRSLRAGERVYRPGDPADVLYVLASGTCALYGVRRGESQAAMIRNVSARDVFGEEATVASFGTRQLEARCEETAVIAEVPVVVLRRAIGRAGGAELLGRVERALRRAATLDLFRTTTFTRVLAERDLELFVDAAEHVHVARGEHVYREGDRANGAFVVADGLLQAQSDDAGKPRVEAYLSRGDLFGDEELDAREPRAIAVVASGPSWLVTIPRDVFVTVARRNGQHLERASRVRTKGHVADPRPGPGGHTTAHVFQDLYRMRVARSLLVIDQDACIRCGHCAWSCASAHDDGISRLVRRGDKIVVDADDGRVAPLLVPNSCQHCKNPSCMIDCPTGAIGRDARGEVFIREDLCTGCGSCAKACPWDNVLMAPRADAKSPFPEVAVKCDLCRGIEGGPACVSSCPTEAIARIDPSAALVQLRIPSGSADKGALAAAMLPTRSPAWPWAVGAALVACGLAAAPLGRWPSGIVAGALVAALVAYSGAKRARGVVARLRARRSLARPLYVAHLGLGVLAGGAVVGHAGSGAGGRAAGALLLAMIFALATGALGALFSVVLPPMLARLERRSVLPEELAALPAEIDAKIYTQLSGKSELVKTLFARLLLSYRRARLGPLWLTLSRRTLREEEKALRGRAQMLLGGKGGDRLAGLDDLVRLVVEHRAARAQRALTLLLRGWLVPHLAATAAAIVLLVLHVVSVTRAGR